MKKVFALFLALTILAAAGLVSADSLEFVPGTPDACSPESFLDFFSSIAQESGFTFTWDEAPAEEDNYSVYTGASADGLMSVRIYIQGDNVSHVVALGEVTLDPTDSESAYTFGQWFGVAISGSAISMSLGAGNTDVVTNPDLSEKLNTDIMPLMNLLTVDFDEEHLSAGKAAATTILGYPCGMEVSGGTDGSKVLLSMKVIVCSQDGQFSVR